jgi:hypothetical protein
MALTTPFQTTRFPGGPTASPSVASDVQFSSGLPATRPAGVFKREHRITEGGTFDDNPAVQAANIANLPGRGISATAPKTLALAPSSLAPSPGLPPAVPTLTGQPTISPLERAFSPETAPVAPAAGFTSGSGSMEEMRRKFRG